MSNRRYDIPPDSSEDSPQSGRLLYVTSARYGADWESLPHTHYFAELFYVKRGRGSFQIENEIFEMNQDDLILVSPHVVHTEHSLSADPLEYIVLGVDQISFSRPDGSFAPWGKIDCRTDHGTIRFCLETMVRELQKERPLRDSLCRHLLDVLMIYILRHEKVNLGTAPQISASREILAARDYIDSNFKNPLSLDVLAKATHLNKYYLAHHFTAAYGISPINYLLERRVEECKSLLVSTDYSISQVARITGFSSSSYLSQRFRASTGMTPRQYRKEFTA